MTKVTASFVLPPLCSILFPPHIVSYLLLDIYCSRRSAPFSSFQIFSLRQKNSITLFTLGYKGLLRLTVSRCTEYQPLLLEPETLGVE